MDIVTALLLANTFAQIAATFIDQARRSGATPEQIAAARADAMSHLDRAAAALAADKPYVVPTQP